MVHFKHTLKGGRVVYRCFCGQEATCSEEEWEAGIRSCKCAGKEREFPTFNLMGKRFGQLTVFSWVGQTEGNVNQWRCRCKCGERITLDTMQLVNGEVKDCGCVARRVVAAKKAMAVAARERRNAKAAQRAELAAKKAAKEARNAAAKAAIQQAKDEAERLRQAEIERLRSYADEQTRALRAELAAQEAKKARQQAVATKIKRIFKLTATAHTRPRETRADSYPRAAAVALTVGQQAVTYVCYCGQQVECSREAWDAGITTCECRPPQSVPLPYYDLRGETIGDLTLQRWMFADTGPRNRLSHHYQAICRCGNIEEVTSVSFTREGHRMCNKCYSRRYYAAKVDPETFPMPAPAALDLSGKRMGKLTVVGTVTNKGHTLWQVSCDCGYQGTAATSDLLTGRARSCTACEEEAVVLSAVQGAGTEASAQLETLKVLGQLQRPHAKLLKLGQHRVAYKCFCGKRANCSREEWEHGIHACSCDKFTDRFPLLDLHGLQVGNLIVRGWAGLTPPPKTRQQSWECKCACGNLVNVLETDLLTRQKTSCGCLPAPGPLLAPVKPDEAARPRRGRPPRTIRPDLVGQTFGELTALGHSPSGQDKIQCRCSCGSYVEVSDAALRGGKLTSCGCKPSGVVRRGRQPIVLRIDAPAPAGA